MIPRNRLLFLLLVITSLFLTFRYVYRTDQFSSAVPIVEHKHPDKLPIPPPQQEPPASDLVTPPKDPKKDEEGKVEAEPQEPIAGDPEPEHHGKEGDDDEHPEVHDTLKEHKPEDKGLGAMKPKPQEHEQSGVDDFVTAKPKTTGGGGTVSEEDKANEASGTTTTSTSALDTNTKWIKAIEEKVTAAVEASKQSAKLGKKDVKSVGERSALLTDLYRQQVAAKFTSTVLEKSIVALQGAMYPWLTHSKFTYNETAGMMASVSHGAGKRGLVIPVSAGGQRLAAHLILTVRKVLKSKIPIEIVYMGDEDLKPDVANRLKSMADDVKPVDIKKGEYFDNDVAGLPEKHAMKSFAVLASSFDEVIIADQDVIFFGDPLSAFESEEYLSTGTVFYHARANIDPSKKEEHKELVTEIERVLQNVPFKYKQNSRFFESDKNKQSGSEMDSSVYVVDKRRTWPALLMSANLNAKPLRNDWTYDRMKTDQESYWLAFALSHVRYNFSASYAGDIGTAIHPSANGGMDPPTVPPTVNATHMHAYEMGTYICDLHPWHSLDSKRSEAFWMSGSLFTNPEKKDPDHLLQPDRIGFVEITQGEEGFVGSGKEPLICLGGKKREINVLGVEEVNKLKEMVELVKGKVEV